MRQGLLSWILLGATLVFSNVTHAFEFGIAASTGDGVVGMTPYRIAYLWDFGPVFKVKNAWQGRIILEQSAAYWKGRARPNQVPKSNHAMGAFTTGPILRWQRRDVTAQGLIPYFEAGIGASWLTKREMGGRHLSTHFQFEDRIGFGFRFGDGQKFDFNYRIYHYSNGSIKRPNRGLEFQMITLGRWLG